MKKISLLCCLMSVLFVFAQKPESSHKFKGQAPIKIVPTNSKPTQKQWKGEYTFDNGSVVFSNDFDGARLNGVIQENDSTYTALITSENTPVNISPWYAFKVRSKTSKKIHLMLTYQDGIRHRYYPKLSSDGEKWKALDSISYSEFEKGEKTIGPSSLPLKVSVALQIGPKTLWVAGQELQTSKHVSSWSNNLARKRYVSYKSIGKSTEGRDMAVLTIGKVSSKRMLMVISRQHPPEVTGYLAMKSFVETIASNSKLAKKFRKKYTTYVVPLMNPDGVDNGHWRHSQGGIDLNRDWSNFNQPETKAVKQFMENKVKENKGKFYFGIDFHSTWDDIYYTIDDKFKGNMPGLVPSWLSAVKKQINGYDPNIKPADKVLPTAVSKNYFYVNFGAESLVFEIGDNTSREFIKEKGKISADELMKLMLKKID
ncbi:MAG: hypothetical protein ACI9SI_001571 [Polaribacter sp.]|jgi:hypothetical protein